MQPGFSLDDSWIHQVVSRNFAQDGSLGFVPGKRSSGSTSLLLTLLLAVKWKLFPALSPVVYSAWLSGTLLVATGWGLIGMARADGLSETACWIWALTPALDGNYLWLGTIGMEHVLFVTLSVWAIYLWFRSSARSAIFCALCLGALTLTRPEGLVLAVLILASSRWARRGKRDVLPVVIAVAGCSLISLIVNFVTSHSWLPATYAGRKLLYWGVDRVPLWAHVRFFSYLLSNLFQPWPVLKAAMTDTLNFSVSGIFLAVMLFGVWTLVGNRRMRAVLLVVWCVVHIGIYDVMLPSRAHGGRYLPLLLLLSLPLLFLGIYAIVNRAGTRLSSPVNQWLPAGAMIVIIALAGWFSLRQWRVVTDACVRHIEGTHGQIGKLILNTLPPGTPVGSFDIGRIGYVDADNLVDLSGLSDTAFIPYLRNRRMLEYLYAHHIRYFVWPSLEDGQSAIPYFLDTNSPEGRKLKVVALVCTPHDQWKRGFTATGNAATCQTLYQLPAAD